MSAVQSRRVSFQKHYKGRPSNSKVVSQLVWGSIGLRSCELARISNLQLRVAIRFLLHYLPRGVKLIRRVFPDKPVSVSSVGTRIGKGKGPVGFWRTYIKKGHIFFELEGVSVIRGMLAFQIVKAKLPFIRTLVLRRFPLKLFICIVESGRVVIALDCKLSGLLPCGFESHLSH